MKKGKQEEQKMRFRLESVKSAQAIWDKKGRRKKAVQMLEVLCKEGGMAQKGKMELFDYKIPCFRRVVKTRGNGELQYNRNIWEGSKESQVRLYYKKRKFDGIHWSVQSNEDKYHASMQVILAACLLCEYITEGELILKFYDETREEKEKMIEAIRWLKYLFPKENFETIIDHRKNENSLRQLGYVKWEYSDALIAPKEHQQLQAIFDSARESLEDPDTLYDITRPKSLHKLDAGFSIGWDTTLAITLLLVYLWEVCRKNFHLDKEQLKVVPEKEYEKRVESVFRSIEKLREGDIKAEIQWTKYDIPYNTKYRICHAEPKTLIMIIADVSGLPYSKVQKILYRVVPKAEVERRTKEKREAERKERERARALCQIPMETKKYLKFEWLDGSLEEEGLLLYKKGDRLMKDTKIKLEKFAQEYKKCYKKIEKQRMGEEEILEQIFEKMGGFLNECIITNSFIFDIIYKKKYSKEYLAAMMVIEKRKKDVERRIDKFIPKLYMDLLENKNLRKQYLGF